MFKRLILLILCGSSIVAAQTKVDVERQGRNTNFLSPPFSAPLRSGEILPPSCATGELYFLTSAPAGGNIQVCHSPGEWAPQGSAGQASVTVHNNGSLVGTRPVLSFATGTGMMQVLTDSGSAVEIQQAVDTAVVMTKASSQSGATLLCDASIVVADAYACSMAPTLTAYQSGMMVHWKPAMTPVGSEISLNIDLLGAKRIRLADGVSNPSPPDIIAGQIYPLWYDGTQFRFLATIVPENYLTTAFHQSGAALYCESGGTLGSLYTCNVSPALERYEKGMALYWRPDVSSVGTGLTLNVNSLGARPVTLEDGFTAPAPNEIEGGRLYLIWYDGTSFRIVNPPRKPFLLESDYQSGASLRCEATVTQGTALACSLVPAIASYERGMVLHFLPDIDVNGPLTLDVDSLGAKPVKLADGTTDPSVGDLHAGQMYPIWFDGTQFRLRIEPPALNNSTFRPTCDAIARGTLWLLPGEAAQKDEVAICAKDEADLYAWRLLY